MPINPVPRILDAIRRYGIEPEEIERVILMAINIGLCLESGGDDQVAEGFNHDVLVNGRGFIGGPSIETKRPLADNRKSLPEPLIV